MFNSFDRLLLLSDGEVVYFGSIPLCKSYFESLGYRCQMTNPAEFVVFVATLAQEGGKTSELANVARQQSAQQSFSIASQESQSEISKGWLRDLFYRETADVHSVVPLVLTLLQRDLLSLIRRKFVFAICTRMFLIGIFIGHKYLSRIIM